MGAAPGHAAAVSSTLLAYRPPARPASALVRRSDVGALAWAGMLHDRVLCPLWRDVAVRADEAVDPGLRAEAFTGLVPRRAVVGHAAAAWVHAGGVPPDRVVVVVRPGGRRTDPHPARIPTEGLLGAGDVVALGGVKVTSVQRTGLDVARWLPDDEAARLLAELVPVGFDPGAALATLDELRGARHTHRARHLLATL